MAAGPQLRSEIKLSVLLGGRGRYAPFGRGFGWFLAGRPTVAQPSVTLSVTALGTHIRVPISAERNLCISSPIVRLHRSSVEPPPITAL